ncbi:MAG: hypothetical protein SXV54_06650, partial [Chloroflexota bacterium]|nr:hypothetical protein [Chloroflexota bacterium]
ASTTENGDLKGPFLLRRVWGLNEVLRTRELGFVPQPNLRTAYFDWREFAVATGVGFVSGAFPGGGGSGAVAGAIRGVLANEAQYVLSSAWTGTEMSLEGGLVSGATGGLTGAWGGAAESKAFDSVQEAAEMYSRRAVSGAPRFASESLSVYTKMTGPAALWEGMRTSAWEFANNILQAIGNDLTTDYTN